MKKILFIVAICLVFSFGLIYASGTAEQGSGENNSPNSNSSNNSNGTSVQENVPNLETLEGTNAKPIDETVLACMAAKNSFDNALQLNDLIEASNIFVATASRKNIDDLEKFPEIEQTINQMKQDFENALQNISFEVISKPATPVKGKAFNKPFAVKVLNNNNAMPNVKLSVSFPSITSDGLKKHRN